MKTHGNKRSKSNSLKHGYRKYFTRDIRKCINGLFYICENTNLHGFRYIGMNGLTIIESVFWFVVCLLSIVFCVILMLRLWVNYSKNPIVTTIDTSNPIWDVAFPGVTICNNNKVYRPQADIIAEYLYTYGFSADESDKYFSLLMKLIRPDQILTDNITAWQVLDNLDMTVEQLMKQLMQPCSALLVRCAWIGEIHDCNKIFKMVKSKEGFCCAFNSHYDLNIGIKFNDTHPSETDGNSNVLNVTYGLPGVHEILKAPGSGRDVGLAVALDVERNMYKATSRPYVGASIMIHDPIDFPDVGAHIASVPPGHVLAISVTGTSIKSMASLRNLPLEKRSCYFDDEVPGETRYSYQSCITGCIAEHMHSLCGCLPFYYPVTHKARTCYLPDLNCILKLRRTTDYSDMETCRKCLPQCNDMYYHINPEGIKMDDVGFDSDLMHGLDLHNVSFIYVFFGDVSYVEYRRESILSWDSLLASFGGIFGLCLGGSVMSVIELVYLLIRQLFKRRLRKRQEQLRMNLPPASELFLSIPAGKVQLQKPRDHRESSDKRVFVSWYQPNLHRRKATYHGDVDHKRVKF